MGPKKNGRVPGILWNAPTYVTELVGYLYRRKKRPIVCVLYKKNLCPQGPANSKPALTTGVGRDFHGYNFFR
jgi:hypothetical protein